MSINEINNSIWQSHNILKHMGYASADESELDSLYSNVWKLIADVFENDYNLSVEELNAIFEQALEEIEIEKQIQMDKLELEFAKIAYMDAIEDIILSWEEITLQIAEAMYAVRELEIKEALKELEVEAVKLDVARLKVAVDKLEAQLRKAQALFKIEEANLEVRKGELEAQRVILKRLITESDIKVIDAKIRKKEIEKLLVDVASAELDTEIAQLKIREAQEQIAIARLGFGLQLAQARQSHFIQMTGLLQHALNAIHEWKSSELASELEKRALISALTAIEKLLNYEDKITPLIDTLNQASAELAKLSAFIKDLERLQQEATNAENNAIKASIAADTTMTKAFEAKSKILGIAHAFASKVTVMSQTEQGESLDHYIGTGK